MFCPGCSAYLNERELIKTAVKYAPGNVAVEYEAQCPKCSVIMGKVSWGQLIPDPSFDKKGPSSSPGASKSEDFSSGASQSERKRCPHCGKTLPEDY